MQKVSFRLTGIAPILFHNVYSMDLKKPKKVTHAEFEETEELLRAKLYIENEKLTLPPRMIIGMLKMAAARSGIKQDGKRSTYASIVRAVLFCLDPVILDQDLTQVKKHREYVTVNRSKILRIFPKLDKGWSGTASLHFDEKQISQETLEELFNYAGNYVGLGDYRPEYGRFTVIIEE